MFEIGLTTSETQRLAKKWSSLKHRFPVLVSEVALQATSKAVSEIKREGFTGGERLTNRSGNLRDSFQGKVFTGTDQVTVMVGSDLPYARSQEYGGTIFGKPWLAVPLPSALGSSGIPAYPNLRSIPDLRFIKRKGKNPLMARVGKGFFIPMYVLVHSVTLKARLGLRTVMQRVFVDESGFFIQSMRRQLRILING